MTLRLLCIVAHPDDETRLTGGLLALLATRAANIHVLCLTRGEGGELGEPALTTREELGGLRAQEMHCAVAALGVTGNDFLGYVDPTVGPGDELFAPEHDTAELNAQISNVIAVQRPEVILTHGSNGEYGHPAHCLLHEIVSEVVKGLSEPTPLLYSFAANYPDHPYPRLTNTDDSAHIVVDISDHFAALISAAKCHRTQHALFGRRLSEEWGRPVSLEELIRLVPREGLHRHWPPLDGAPHDRLQRALLSN